MEKDLKKNVCVCMCVELNQFAVRLKLTQHCKLTVLQLKNKRQINKRKENKEGRGIKKN